MHMKGVETLCNFKKNSQEQESNQRNWKWACNNFVLDHDKQVCCKSQIFNHYNSRYAKTVGAKHFHTSAKLNKGVEEMFFELAKRKCYFVL